MSCPRSTVVNHHGMAFVELTLCVLQMCLRGPCAAQAIHGRRHFYFAGQLNVGDQQHVMQHRPEANMTTQLLLMASWSL